ncbi:hypothetical protein ACFQ1I_03525 [Kitasatospora arboriphila]
MSKTRGRITLAASVHSRTSAAAMLVAARRGITLDAAGTANATASAGSR